MSNRFISWSIFIILCFIWGSSFILMSNSKDELNAAQIASLRIFSAGIVFLPFAIFHISKIPKNKIITVILAGIFGNLLPAFLFAWGIMKIDSSLEGILNSLTPICVIVIGIVFFRDKIKKRKIIGVLIGFLGLVLLTLFPMFMGEKTISFDNLSYTLLVVLATILYGINVNIVSHYLKGLKPIPVATVSLAFMAIPSVLVLWQTGFFQLDFADHNVQWSAVCSITLGVVGSAIATALFYILVQKAGGLFASLVTYGIPFVALFWGFIYGEKIDAPEIACLGIILVGVYLANKPEKPTQT